MLWVDYGIDEECKEVSAMLDPIGFFPSVMSAYETAPSGDNERVERAPDNETAEMQARAKAPLPAWQGTTLDTEA